MTAPAVVPREQAFADARRVLDAALDRIARDRAAGRLSPETVAYLAAAEQRRAARLAVGDRAAA
ncbi:hypothetical protein QEP66_00930 [Streptomyces sp. LB8]|uniref:hypothetical protein n=1 Tax=Streptomyces sp. LB8 TaxID=3042509 RepID=UPI00264A3C83|nr:hypothetical protein [Streptomyces sp. LB8]MDN5380694.1 hypothetical protein [Streptomyces sp. LB8]